MKTMFRTVFGKALFATAALGGFLLLAGAPGAKANDWDDCHRRVAYSELRYRAAVERCGPYCRDAATGLTNAAKPTCVPNGAAIGASLKFS